MTCWSDTRGGAIHQDWLGWRGARRWRTLGEAPSTRRRQAGVHVRHGIANGSCPGRLCSSRHSDHSDARSQGAGGSWLQPGSARLDHAATLGARTSRAALERGRPMRGTAMRRPGRYLRGRAGNRPVARVGWRRGDSRVARLWTPALPRLRREPLRRSRAPATARRFAHVSRGMSGRSTLHEPI